MAMRRPRIKASANLMKPRKPKIASENSNSKPIEVDDQIQKHLKNVDNLEDLIDSGERDVTKANIEHQTATETDVLETKTIKSTGYDQQQKSESEHGIKHSQHTSTDESFSLQSIVPFLENSESIAITEPNIATKPQDENQVTLSVHPDQKKVEKKIIPPKTEPESSSFKYPPNVAFHRSNSYSATSLAHGNDDAFQTDLEESVIQMDLLKSTSNQEQYPLSPMSPMSPSKSVARQRIRATPVFGQRRNSFVGSSPSPHTVGDVEGPGGDFSSSPLHRRERHFSASLSQNSNTTSSSHLYHYHTPHKYIPTMGRIRTESGCSAFSDSYAPSSKSRKTDQDQHHRAMSRRDFEARFNNGVVPDKSMLKMFDLIYYNPLTNPMEQKPNITKLKQEANTNAEDAKSHSSDMIPTASIKPEKGNVDTTEAKREVGLPVPQLKLNSAGELILDDKSLEIETTAEQEARKVLANSSLIFLDENTGMNGFYKRQKRTKEWPHEETIKFYRCLQTVGTDFSLMGQLFPNRTRRDLKLKFKKEERCNLTLINKALLYPKTFNIDELQVQFDKEEWEREEANRKWKEIKAQDAKNVKKVAAASAADRAIPPNDVFYLNENVTKQKLSRRAKRTKPNPTNNNKKNNNNKNLHQEINDDTTTVAEKEQPKKKRSRLEKQNVKVDNVSVVQANAFNIKSEINELKNDHLPMTAASKERIELENDLSDLFQNIVNQPQVTESFAHNSYAVDTSGSHQYEIIENKSLVNLDDGTVTFINDDDEEDAILPHNKHASTMVENSPPHVLDEDSQATCDMDESDIQQILTELSEGTMVLVSTLDPNNDDKVLNEIYMLDKVTGDLCERPLDIPDAIVQGILNVMS